MASKVDQRIVVQLPICCMYEVHGYLTGYQNADGGISIKPCEFCIHAARLLSDKLWREKIKEALDG